MDTLFRLVSLHSSDEQQQHQQSSLNSSRTSSSSRSSRHAQHNQYLPSAAYFEVSQEEECGGFINLHQPYFYNSSSNNNNSLFMDEDFSSSSSSSKHFHPPAAPPPPDLPLPPNLDLFADPNRRWASDLLIDCARAVASRDSPRVQQLMWMLNELASPYGDLDQKLASYFLQALFARLTTSGPRTLRTLSSASDRTASFDSTRRTALRFQELSPWSSFGHVAANGAILESFLLHSPSSPPTRLHILDLSTTFCTQWPTLLEALATRSAAEDTPHLSITTVVPSTSPTAHRVMREIAARMEKFARLMAVPFRFSVVHHPDSDLSALDLDSLISSGSSSSATALAVNCVNSLHGVSPTARRREALLAKIRRLRPRIVTVVEEEAELDFDEDDEEGFLKGFREGLRFFSVYFDSLEESFPKTSNERLALERAAGRAMVDLVACPEAESTERRETAARWSRRMRLAGFSPLAFSDDVADDLRALLRRYKEGWSMRAAVASEDAEESSSSGGGGGGGAGAGMFLTWREEAVVWASAWKA